MRRRLRRRAHAVLRHSSRQYLDLPCALYGVVHSQHRFQPFASGLESRTSGFLPNKQPIALHCEHG